MNPKSEEASLDSRDGVYRGTNPYFYGRFCGPSWPKVDEAVPEKALAVLLSIKPVDRLDLICKHHDICYQTKHYFLQTCDNSFFQEVQDTRFNDQCRNYAVMLINALLYKPSYNPVPADPGQVTLFGWKRLDLSGNPLVTPLGLSTGEVEFTLHGWTKPKPGSC